MTHSENNGAIRLNSQILIRTSNQTKRVQKLDPFGSYNTRVTIKWSCWLEMVGKQIE